mgnify:CR=1 FL=1
MSDLETIKFQKLSIAKFSEKDRKDLVLELKKRKISCRTTETAIIFDERYLKHVRDLIPASLR